MLSSRDISLDMHKEYYANAPSTQKLFGMGYSGNYTKKPRMIEMDYFDIFFSTGIIGTILFFIPYLYFGLRITITF
ncbi:O-antigen ligase family protein [Bacillus sp. N9]